MRPTAFTSVRTSARISVRASAPASVRAAVRIPLRALAVRRAAVVAGVLLTVSAPAAVAIGVRGPVHGASDPARTTAAVGTPAVHDDEQGGHADADDPAVWVDPDDPGRKFTRWDRLAAAFPEPLTVDPDSFDPRDPD